MELEINQSNHASLGIDPQQSRLGLCLLTDKNIIKLEQLLLLKPKEKLNEGNKKKIAYIIFKCLQRYQTECRSHNFILKIHLEEQFMGGGKIVEQTVITTAVILGIDLTLVKPQMVKKKFDLPTQGNHTKNKNLIEEKIWPIISPWVEKNFSKEEKGKLRRHDLCDAFCLAKIPFLK